MTGIYLHIPFCKQACSYCDFYFVTRTGQKAGFVRSLTEEIARAAEKSIDKQVNTIYFGGGTPSLLAADEVNGIMSCLRRHYDLSGLQEVTFEMNPDDVNAGYLAELAGAGITRVSMGVQTFDAERLRFMNRAHSRQEAIQSLELLGLSPLRSYNVDLIYGNPGQTVGDLAADVEVLMQYDPPHLSAYALTIEPRTRLGMLSKKGILKAADDDMVAQHMDYLSHMLASRNTLRYEVSNYAKPGQEARHNSGYWNHADYIGFGPAAHSFVWDKATRKARRWKNTASLKSYMADKNKTDQNSVEHLGLDHLAEERLMMGLRTREGVLPDQLKHTYEYSLSETQLQYLNRICAEGYMTMDQALKLTPKGLKLADTIILTLLQ
ncbi:MAG: radical SAM family heme chaperone HemW [Balneolales bacterium]